MRFIGYTNLQDGNSSLCSIAWITFPGTSLSADDKKYTVPHNCSDFPDYDNIFPTNTRILNPPPQIFKKNLTSSPFYNKIDDPYTNTSTNGNIFPVSIKAKIGQAVWISPGENDNSREYIGFSSDTTFNGIRTNYSQIPYLLQDPANDTRRCNIKNKHNANLMQIIANPGTHFANQTICQHVLKFPFAGTDGSRSWQEIVLINDDSGVSHPIHQHGGWYWVVGEGQFNYTINRTYIIDLYEQGLLNQNTQNETMSTVWNYPDEYPFLNNNRKNLWILPKDVIQVPNQGYVIIRTHLDNPGTFIFHCHIDFHLSIGMGLGKSSILSYHD